MSKRSLSSGCSRTPFSLDRKRTPVSPQFQADDCISLADPRRRTSDTQNAGAECQLFYVRYRMVRCLMRDVGLSDVDLSNVGFSGVGLSDVALSNVRFSDVGFSGFGLSDVDLSNVGWSDV